MPPNLIDIINKSVDDYLFSSNAGEQVARENFRKGEALLGELQQVQEQAAADAALIKQTEKTADLKAQQYALKAANAAGVDPTNAADEIILTMGKLKQSHDVVEKSIENLQRQTNVRLVDDPLAWIQANVFNGIEDAQDKLRVDATAAEFQTKKLQAYNQSIQQVVQTSNQIKESVTAESVQASARLAAAEANSNAIKVAIEGLKYNTLEVQAATDASKERLGVLFQARSAQQAEKQLQISYAHLKLDQERFNWQKEERNLAAQARAEGREIDSLLIGRINTGRAILGLPVISGLEAKQAVQLIKTGASKDLGTYYDLGTRSQALGGKQQIGTSPAEATQVLTDVPSALPQAQQKTAELLKRATDALAQTKTVDRKDPKAVAAFINSHVKNQIEQDYSLVTPGSGNIFDAGDLNIYITSSTLRSLPVVQKLLAPAAEAQQPLSDPKLVLGLVTSAVKAGQLTTKEAVEISTVYQQASLINQASRNLTGFGIVPPNAGRNYYARMGGFGTKVDLTNPTEVTRYISLELSKQMGYQYRGDLPKETKKLLDEGWRK